VRRRLLMRRFMRTRAAMATATQAHRINKAAGHRFLRLAEPVLPGNPIYPNRSLKKAPGINVECEQS
jgi:hypothetical protein